MIIPPEIRPFTLPEVQKTWWRWEGEEHSRLIKRQKCIDNGEVVPATLEVTTPHPIFPVPTVLLTDSYVLEAAKYRYHSDSLITIILGVLMAVDIVKFNLGENTQQTIYELVALLIMAGVLAFPFDKDKEVYEALIEEQPKTYKSKKVAGAQDESVSA